MTSVFQQKFLKYLPDRPTEDQVILMERMERFLFQTKDKPGFIIRGYAGTGKTTAIAAMVKTLPFFSMQTILLAPTGRAAKVMLSFSQKMTLTIHKQIYMTKRGKDGQIVVQLAKNLFKNTCFIVDESSMIGNGETLKTGYGGRDLLSDLINYVYSGQDCRLVFVGDTAQLPPVGLHLSPALDPKYLKVEHQLQLKGVELSQVMRQVEGSGILFNATELRAQVLRENPLIKFHLHGFNDILRIDGYDLEEELDLCYSKYGESETVVICRSNKRANNFNQQIRVRIKFLEEKIATGDYIMVVKNNYFWLDEESPIGFIANGDIAEIMSLGSIEQKYGFLYIDARLRLVDYSEPYEIEAKLLLDTLMSDSASLSNNESRMLFENVMSDYANISNKKERYQKLKENPYYNALQVKFAYAITCHKSQGGEWKAVFVDQGYLTKEMVNQEYIRWLYTAITRAKEQLYLVNFASQFFDKAE